FSWARCRTLFDGDNLSPPLKTLTPTKAESESDWWKTSLEYFEGKDVQSEAVSEQLEIEKDALSEEVQKKKKRKRCSSPPSFQNPTYDQLMTTVSTLEGTVTTLTQTVSSLHGSNGTLESRLLTLEGTIDNLESRLLALKGDERDFGVVSDGDIPAYMSPGPSYTSPASTVQKSLSLANRRRLRVRRTPLNLKSPMRCYSHTKGAAKDVTKDTISIPMTTTEKLKDTIHIDAAAQDTFCIEDELQFIRMEKGDKPNYDLPDLSKIKRNKYPIYSTFEKKKTDCYLDCLPKGRTCKPSFWEILYPGGKKAEYLDEGKLDGLHINAFIELMMRKRPHEFPYLFSIVLHHEGRFSGFPIRKYLHGKIHEVNFLNIDDFRREDMHNIMKKISDATGVVENIESNDYFCYFQKPNCDLNVGLQQLWTEEDYMDLYMYIGHGKTQFLHIYIVKEEINEECEAC
nr:ATPase, F1/V1/A1 complex, alpha/beta subunit, zinc knuckle CX2CX4HX4C [Tanacetum cinerariifolium]